MSYFIIYWKKNSIAMCGFLSDTTVVSLIDYLYWSIIQASSNGGIKIKQECFKLFQPLTRST